MPRAIWSGTISFGLVSVPVRMTSAVSEHKLHFNYVHERDGSPIGYEKVCKKEDKPVPDDEIVKAFEVEKGEWVYMSDEDFEAAAVEEGAKTVDIRAFVPYEDIDPIYFERTYYLEPQEGGEKVYSLLARAMEESGLAGVAKLVMRERQHLACLRVREPGVITLERMHFADEIRSAKDVAPRRARLGKEELEMAKQLVEQFSGSFEPETFRDTYRDTLCEIIRAKQRGETVAAPEAPEAEEPVDLMSALRASIDAAKGRRPAGRRSGGKRLERLSKEELYELAKQADLPGRSDMSKDELVEALKAA
jgi:DNA end-binding protein Ku